MTIRLLLADDHPVVRAGLRAVLDTEADFAVVAEAATAERAVELAAGEPVDVVLMDLRMPVMDGIEATRLLAGRHPEVAVVVLTTFADDDSILGALGAGARGYLTKNAGRQDITRAIRAAAAGQSVLDREVQDRLLATVRTKASPPDRLLPEDLTPREREVLALIGRGLSNRGIAEQLFISEATVKTHINNLFAKAGIRDRADAVRRAIASGLA